MMGGRLGGGQGFDLARFAQVQPGARPVVSGLEQLPAASRAPVLDALQYQRNVQNMGPMPLGSYAPVMQMDWKGANPFASMNQMFQPGGVFAPWMRQPMQTAAVNPIQRGLLGRYGYG